MRLETCNAPFGQAASADIRLMDGSVQSVLGLVLGILLFGYVEYAKVSEYRFRRRSIRVQGKVLKVYSHQHSTSYFLSYDHEGVTRAAEYCGVPLRREFEPGDTVEILIDPTDPPDSEVPGDTQNAPGRGIGAGNCSRVDASFLGLWDGVYLVMAIALIVYSLK